MESHAVSWKSFAQHIMGSPLSQTRGQTHSPSGKPQRWGAKAPIDIPGGKLPLYVEAPFVANKNITRARRGQATPQVQHPASHNQEATKVWGGGQNTPRNCCPPSTDMQKSCSYRKGLLCAGWICKPVSHEDAT